MSTLQPIAAAIVPPVEPVEPAEPVRIRWRWKNVLLIVVIILLGLALHVVSLWLGESKERDEFLKALSAQVASALLIGGIWAVINDFLLRRDFLRILDANADRVFRASSDLTATVRDGNDALQRQLAEKTDQLSSRIAYAKQEESAGLVEVRLFSHDYDFHDLIRNSRRLVVISNDAGTWTSAHALSLRRRFANPETETIFILLHPGAPVLSALAYKYEISVEALRRKINDTVALIEELRGDNTTVEIVGHSMVNAYAGYVGDGYAVMRPYFNAQGRQNLPLFRVAARSGDGECLYNQIREDSEALLQSSMKLGSE